MVIIETQGLAKSFKSRLGGKQGTMVEAVKGVDLKVREGEIFGFLGPNGAGKSTTMRMLATLLPPSKGSATVVGHDLLREPARVRDRIGYVGQAGGAEESLTGRENLILQAQLYGMSFAAARGRANELIDALDLVEYSDRRMKTYSGGQKRRLDIAMGMAHRPALLFLDEPTTGLDPQSRARLWDEVRKLREGGTTVFLTTHYLDEADALADRLAVIDHGQIVTEGAPDALKRAIGGDVVTLGLASEDSARAQALLHEQPYVREARADEQGVQLVVDDGEHTLPALMRLLDGQALHIRTIAMSRPTLDDVFLRLTGRSLRETND